MFVGREAELSFLGSGYHALENKIVVLYGRKGLGKTTLLTQFTKDKPFEYYLARACSEREQRYLWAGELRRRGMEISDFPEYEELFEAILQNGNRNADGKLVLILDEFHHLVKADPAFISRLFSYVLNDQRSSLLVILCSSATGWVENSMIAKIGRSAMALSGVWKLRELKAKEMRKLYPQTGIQDFISFYGILGGNPGLWRLFSPEQSLRENLINTILQPGSLLQEEIRYWLGEELREPAVYQTLLGCMACGMSKLNQIHLHTGFSRAKISVYLKNLMELDLVEKVSSFETEGYAHTQKGVYRISNLFVSFYFRFLYPYQSELEKLSPEEFYDAYISSEIHLYEEQAYRRLCRELLAERDRLLGEWVGKEGSIDIVANDTEGKMYVAQCCYAGHFSQEMYQRLQKCIKQAKLKPTVITVFSEKGYDPSLEKIVKSGKLKVYQIFKE